MNKQQAGKMGGMQTLKLHALEFCPTCHQPVSNGYYQRIGQKGGLATFARVGREGMAEMGRKGGRPRIK